MSRQTARFIALTLVILAFVAINGLPRHYERGLGDDLTMTSTKYGLPFTFLDTNHEFSSFTYQSLLGNLTVLGVLMIGVQVALEQKRVKK